MKPALLLRALLSATSRWTGLWPRPVVPGAPRILGSFPPAEHHTLIGPPQQFFIHSGYQQRTTVEPFEDAENRGEWQEEVYQFAREVADRENLRTVLDFGCGSGFKLMHYFRDRITIGAETPSACARLRRRWPQRAWMETDYHRLPPVPVGLAIAADVIEHLPDPQELLRYFQRLQPGAIVVSTPDRNLLRDGRHDGPPANPAHAREWSFAEFHAFLSSLFRVEAHFISCPPQATQCALCRCRPAER